MIAERWEEDEWKEFIEGNTKGGTNLNSCHCLQMMDNFKIEGLGGKHICMVFELMGVDFLKVMKWYDWEGIPLPLVRIIAKQVLIGLHYLHS